MSQLSAKRSKLTDELKELKSQNVAEGTVSDDLKSIAGICEPPKKRARVTSQCEEWSGKPSTAAFSPLLAELEGYKNHSEALTVKNQCNFRLADEPKELRKKLADRGKTDATPKLLLKVAEENVLPLPKECSHTQDGACQRKNFAFTTCRRGYSL